MKTHHVIIGVILLLAAYFAGIKFPQFGQAVLSKL